MKSLEEIIRDHPRVLPEPAPHRFKTALGYPASARARLKATPHLESTARCAASQRPDEKKRRKGRRTLTSDGDQKCRRTVLPAAFEAQLEEPLASGCRQQRAQARLAGRPGRRSRIPGQKPSLLGCYFATQGAG